MVKFAEEVEKKPLKYIIKCPFCKEYAENIIIRNDGGNYIECPYCGIEIDVPKGEEL